MFFVSGIVLCLVLDRALAHQNIRFTFVEMVVISFCATIAEALSRRGYDNITIPAVVLGLMLVI